MNRMDGLDWTGFDWVNGMDWTGLDKWTGLMRWNGMNWMDLWIKRWMDGSSFIS